MMATRVVETFKTTKPLAPHERLSRYEMKRQRHGGWAMEIRLQDGSTKFVVERSVAQCCIRATRLYSNWEMVEVKTTMEALCLK